MMHCNLERKLEKCIPHTCLRFKKHSIYDFKLVKYMDCPIFLTTSIFMCHSFCGEGCRYDGCQMLHAYHDITS